MIKTDTVSMVVKESAWTQPPLKQDYKNVEKILYDFGIVLSVPKFDTYKELQEWTSETISNVLKLY